MFWSLSDTDNLWIESTLWPVSSLRNSSSSRIKLFSFLYSAVSSSRICGCTNQIAGRQVSFRTDHKSASVAYRIHEYLVKRSWIHRLLLSFPGSISQSCGAASGSIDELSCKQQECRTKRLIWNREYMPNYLNTRSNLNQVSAVRTLFHSCYSCISLTKYIDKIWGAIGEDGAGRCATFYPLAAYFVQFVRIRVIVTIYIIYCHKAMQKKFRL